MNMRSAGKQRNYFQMGRKTRQERVTANARRATGSCQNKDLLKVSMFGGASTKLGAREQNEMDQAGVPAAGGRGFGLNPI